MKDVSDLPSFVAERPRERHATTLELVGQVTRDAVTVNGMTGFGIPPSCSSNDARLEPSFTVRR